VIVVVGLPAYEGAAGGEGRAAGLAVNVAAAAGARGSSVELVGKVGDDGAGDAVVLGLGRLGIGHAALLRDPAHPTPVIAVAGAAGPKAAAADRASGDAADTGAEAPAGDAPAGDAPAGELAGDVLVDDADDAGPGAIELLPTDPAARPGLEAGDISLALRYLSETRVIVLAEPLPEAAVAAAVEGAAYGGARLVVLLPPGATPPNLPPDATVLEAPAVDDGSFGRVVGVFAAGLDAGAEPAAAFAEAVKASGWEPVTD
jgi:hypothetical protein